MIPPSQPPRAGILLVGTELLRGEIHDRNGAFMGRELTQMGFSVETIVVVPDEVEAIVERVRELKKESDLLVLMGGLGPTGDDLTTEALAQALYLPLEFHEESWERIVLIYQSRGRTPPEVNRKQALVPKGAEVFSNPHGTAPGYLLEHQGSFILVLPGPPKENQAIFATGLAARLKELFPQALPRLTRTFRVFGLTESQVAERVQDLEHNEGVEFRYLFRFPEILVLLATTPKKEPLLNSLGETIRSRLDPYIYSEGENTLPQVVGELLKARGLKIVTVESCTGGLAAKLLTDTPGSSAWFERGFVVYSNAAKEELLGVPRSLLDQYGAVSEPVAQALLEGALTRSRADLGFSITGIAGPEGGTPEKPVGTVCIAFGDRGGSQVKTYKFPWDREYNRLISVWTALHRIRLWVLAKEGSSTPR